MIRQVLETFVEAAGMQSTGTPQVLAMIHLVMLSLWGGVVATEAVIELYPFRHREQHAATIRLHYWIDILVETAELESRKQGFQPVKRELTGWLARYQKQVTNASQGGILAG